MRRRLRFALILLAIPALYADVTLRYKTEIKLNPALPAQLTQAGMKSLDALPKESSMQFRNGKGYNSSAMMRSICDFAKQEMTLLDAEGRRYATVKYQEFGDLVAGMMPAMPDKAKAGAANMKMHFESKVTGRTETIQGVEGEEHVMIITMDSPAGTPGGTGPAMRMVTHLWMAKNSETMRVPAIREVAGYNLFAAATMNPVAMLQRMFQQLPGAADFFQNYMKEFQSSSMVTLRMQMEQYMPMMAAVVKAMGGGEYDPETPFMTMSQDLVEISTAPVADSLFQIPEGYQPAPAADVLSAMMKKFQPAAK